MAELARRAIKLGDISDRAVLDTDLGDSSSRPGREQNGVFPDPCSARIRRGVANDAHLVACKLQHFQLALGEKADRLAVWRPEWRAAIFAAGQDPRGAGVKRPVPDGTAPGAALPGGEYDVATVGGDRRRLIQNLPFIWKIDDDARQQWDRSGAASRLNNGRNDHDEQSSRNHTHPRDRDAAAPRPRHRRLTSHGGAGLLHRVVFRKRLRRCDRIAGHSAFGLDRNKQPIPAARNRLDESRRVRRILQGLTQSADRGVQPMIEVDERPFGPEPEPELFATDHFTGPFEQGGQEGKRLVGEQVRAAFAPQLSRLGVELKWSEAEHPWSGLRHGGSSERPIPKYRPRDML